MDSMSPTVTKFEPHQALFADNHGYAIYESIIEDLPYVIVPGSQLCLKLATTKETLKNLFQKYPDKI